MTKTARILGPDGRPLRRGTPRFRVRAGYDAAADTNRTARHWLNADALSAREANSLQVRKTLRERARYEVANNSYAKGIVLTLANHLVGTGPRLQVTTGDDSLNRAVEVAFSGWARITRFADQLRTMKQSKVVDGEAFGIFATNGLLQSPVQLDVRLIEADQFTTPNPMGTARNDVDGIRFDDAGNIAGYDVLRTHPGGALYWSNDADTIPARKVIHWYRCDRPGQVRGIPELTPALSLFAQLRRFMLATLTAAETAAMHAAVIETDAAGSSEDEDDEADGLSAFDTVPIEIGTMATLPAGAKLNQLKPEHPAASCEAFVKLILREIARCINMPWNIAAGDSSAYNYSSARLDHLNYRAAIEVERQDCEREVLDRILAAWLEEAVMIPGHLPPGIGAYLADMPHVWHWPAAEYIDPLVEVQADQLSLTIGSASLADVCAKRGRDWRQVIRQRAMEKAFESQVAAEMGVPAAPSDQVAASRPALAIHAAAAPSALIFAAAEVVLQASATNADGSPALRRFAMTAYTGGAMSLPGFNYPVVVDLAGLQAARARYPILRDHRPWKPVGHTDSVTIDGKAVTATGVFSGAGPDAREVLASAGNGFPWQASIGASADDLQFIERGQQCDANGQTFTGPCYVARKATLKEISFVPNGADANTTAALAAASGGIAMTFEKWILSLGFTVEDLTDQQRAALEVAFADLYPDAATGDAPAVDGPPPADAAAPPPADAAAAAAPPPAIQAAATQPAAHAADVQAQMRAAAAAELGRHNAIRRACAQQPELVVEVQDGQQRRRVVCMEHAIAAGWSAEQTELAFLRATRPSGFARTRERDCSLEALQGAVLLRAGGRLDHPAYTRPQAMSMRLPPWLRAGLNGEQRQRAMEAAHRYADMSLLDLAREAVRLDGRDCPRGRSGTIEAAFSGGSLTNIFTTSVNARLLESYSEVNDTTAGWVNETEVADFKTQERPRVEIGSGLKRLPRGATADHATFSDNSESYKISRYAEQFVVDEQDIIDDNLGVLTDTPRKLGEAAGWLRPDLVYSLVLANPTLTATSREVFNTTDGNLKTSATFAAATLRAAVSALRLFRENNRNLNLQPTHLLVPPSLEHLAYELINASEITFGGSSSMERGTANSLQRFGLSLISEARLENGVTDPATEIAYSGSATTWYLLCQMAYGIEVAYLSGSGRAPQVRSFALEQGKWGLGWDVKMDIGAKFLDWKGMVKNTG